jgi:hypothetical protein
MRIWILSDRGFSPYPDLYFLVFWKGGGGGGEMGDIYCFKKANRGHCFIKSFLSTGYRIKVNRLCFSFIKT